MPVPHCTEPNLLLYTVNNILCKIFFYTNTNISTQNIQRKHRKMHSKGNYVIKLSLSGYSLFTFSLYILFLFIIFTFIENEFFVSQPCEDQCAIWFYDCGGCQMFMGIQFMWEFNFASRMN